MDTLDQQFELCASIVKSLKTTPQDDELLNIYGLYKQATLGCNTLPKPLIFDIRGMSKWKAWKDKQGMTKEKAKQEYVDNVYKLTEMYGIKE